MNRRLQVSLGTALLSSLGLACSGGYETAGEAIETEAEPVFGTIDPSNLLQAYAGTYSVPIRNIGKTGGNGACTGTQVRRNVVITAHHCITKEGTIAGTEVTPNQLLIGRAGLGSWFSVSATAAACLATTDCNTVKTFVTSAVDDLAVLYLEPTEPRLGLDDIIYVPLLASNPTQVGKAVEIAGYGKYNPFNDLDAHNFELNFGHFTVTAIDTANTVQGNRGGVTTKLSGNESNKTQGGDSGSGVFFQTTPPGILAVNSGGQSNCNWDTTFCSVSEGPTPFGFNGRFVNGEDNVGNVYPVGARDWEFNAAADFNDFDLVKVAANIGSPGWQVSSGNFTPWNNVGANYMLARTVMETGCIQTAVRTDDDDESGIVFRYLDNLNYYIFWANDQVNRIGISRVTNGVGTELTRGTWIGNWVTSTPLLVCMYGQNIQAWINPGTASEVNIAAVELGSTILGGRLGLWNNLNQGARHGYLRTMGITDGQARVNTFLRL